MVLTLNDPSLLLPPFSKPPCNSPGHVNPKNKRFMKMTREQFAQWLDKVDANNDGYISRQELQDALKVLGLHFKTWRAWRTIKKIDMNDNRVIDPGLERKKLIEHAEKHWGVIITN